MSIDKGRILELVKNLEFEEAISHRVHSRVFEILGYISTINKSNLPDDVRTNIDNVEELSKKLLDEIHLIIDHFTSKKYSEF